MNPKVSVVIPTYNRPDLITRSVKSVLNQTYDNFEVVVIDNNTDDKTEKAVKSLNDSRIKYIRNTSKTNAPASRNIGVKKSNNDTKYVAFIDDDDEFFPTYLEKTVEALEKDDEMAMATTDTELRTKDGKKIRNARGSEYAYEQGIGNGVIVRKKIFTEENFWFDENSKMEDWDLGVRVLKDHKWKCIPEPLWIYYVYPGKGEATVTVTMPEEQVVAFFEKHYLYFRSLGKKPMAYLYFRTGKYFLRIGATKKGLNNLYRAFLIYPNFEYLVSCGVSSISLIFPSIVHSNKLRVIKQKLFRGKF